MILSGQNVDQDRSQAADLLPKNYKSVDEELDDHIWVNKKIDEKANSYFEVLLAAARNKNSWKVVSRPTYNYTAYAAVQLMKTNLVNEAVDTIMIDEDENTIIIDNAELDNMLEKDSKQIDKETKARELTKQNVFVHRPY
ncbi:8756_t:CDS:2 [Cetraspora pellucida]|uniref:8756_t:CDS:1 n=1 Tax=Cetraspora pellucida TaxID=1433469 RepID=A0A9N9FS09_9GLOM|nr:8756_t:CDS:2 [Cetraspora pellucida]